MRDAVARGNFHVNYVICSKFQANDHFMMRNVLGIEPHGVVGRWTVVLNPQQKFAAVQTRRNSSDFPIWLPFHLAGSVHSGKYDRK